ncbi:MAG: hypothetical protein M1393_00465 [Candidatus Thermoplasmatota archaeon]|nr:hypothetical protein [Candidatus Thermoplasmatota archaeon]MDA8143213.1 hypothetical protein [Thermoplasmatales archaeon]
MTWIALDGGATKTVAAVFNEQKEIEGLGIAGPSNYRNIGIPNTVKNIKKAVQGALEQSGKDRNEIKSIILAIAGVKDSDRSTEIIRGIVERSEKELKYQLLNDGEAGYFSRFLDGNGIIAAPGTGMIAYGRYGKRVERSSGWGWLIGDEGGGFYIGKRALQETAKLEDGRSEYSSPLNLRLKKKFNVEKGRDLVNKVYGKKINIREIASLATIVSEMANSGDVLCTDLIREAAKEAAKCVLSLHKRLEIKGEITVSGYGGVYRSGDIYWNSLVETVRKYVPEVKFLPAIYGYHAVSGSILLTLINNGISVEEKDIDYLVKQIDRKILLLSAEERKKYLFMH